MDPKARIGMVDTEVAACAETSTWRKLDLAIQIQAVDMSVVQAEIDSGQCWPQLQLPITFTQTEFTPGLKLPLVNIRPSCLLRQ